MLSSLPTGKRWGCAVWRILWVVCLIIIHALALTSMGTSPSSRQPSSSGSSANDVTFLLREAMQYSNASRNITAAREACQIWNQLLDDEDVLGFQGAYSSEVVVLSLALYSSCLVRIGQDAHAVRVCDKALQMDPTQQDLRLSKAQALQRLLRYADAAKEFGEVDSSPAGAIGAATCALRLGDLSSARSALVASTVTAQDETSKLVIHGMLGVISYLETGLVGDSSSASLQLVHASRADLLYRWISVVLGLTTENDSGVTEPEDALIALIKLNISPFDDPHLLLLDDKVHLHRVLSKYPNEAECFWPPGTIISPRTTPSDIHKTINNSSGDKLYFIKDRSGYGSHGNRIVGGSELLSEHQELLPSANNCEKLLQAMVSPPLLIDGRKFSLRIYVVMFSSQEVYLASCGIVKMAASEMKISGHIVDPRMHVTNSGSALDMEQHDLNYLRSVLESQGHSYGAFWGKIEDAVRSVMHCYEAEREPLEWDSSRESLGIPKILGFDFVMDKNIQPWLVEVNRFPGLEPRDDSDRMIKARVVHDAWSLASQRLSVAPFDRVFPPLKISGESKTNILQRLS